MRTLITNGTIVARRRFDGRRRPDRRRDDRPRSAANLAATVTADETIDATGKYVIPGGIDVHTHMELPFGGTFAKDTFETGTRAAAFGGTTSIVDFAVQSRGASLRAGLDAWHAKAEGNAVADYGFHMIMSDVNDATLAEMDGLVAEGVPDFKLFTAYPGVFYSDDGAIFRAMQQTAKNGGLIMMHAENGMAIDVVAEQTVAAGTTDPIGHGLARKAVFEGEATNRVIRLAEAAGVPVYIVHLSAREALAEVRAARDRGTKAFAETCPQYLFLSLDDLGNGFEGAKFVCSPPLRSKDQWDDLWIGARQGRPPARARPTTARSTSTARRSSGRATSARSRTACRASRTGSTCSTTAASSAGRISRERWVEIVSTAPARMFGMYPRKGAVAVGSDADLVIYDPDRRHTISAKTHHMDVDYSCYEGRTVQGGSDVVLSRGSVIVRDGEFTGRKGHGRFIKRAPADHARMSLTGHGRRGRRPDRRPRRRARDRARGARPRPVRPALVGAPAADRSGRHRGRPSRLLPGRRDGRDDGQLPGHDAGLRGGRAGPRGGARRHRDERRRSPGEPATGTRPRPASQPPRPARRRVGRAVRRDAGRRVRVPRRLRPWSRRRSRDVHAPRIEALLDAGVDLLAFETIPTVREAEVLVGLLDEVDAPAWLSYSCRDGRRRRPASRSRTAVALGRRIRASSPSASTAPRPAFLPALLAAARSATDRSP